MRYCDGVFEGGGVKGIGFAGAVRELERQGYSFQNVVGTSAGAIAAALLAAGYTGAEIESELLKVDFSAFRQDASPAFLGRLGKTVHLARKFGVYKSDNFEKWISELLARKGKRFFADIRTLETDERYKYKFQAVASDLTDNRLLVLPRDLALLGLDPDRFEIARAVRMSMSIPFYYEPCRLTDTGGTEHVIVDGGLLSNYPVWLLDDGTSSPPWPTFGFKFFSKDDVKRLPFRKITNILEFSEAVVKTMLEAGDNYHISVTKGDFQRSILIPTVIKVSGGIKSVKTTDFGITPEESAALAENGKMSACRFLTNWDFEAWKKTYRQQIPGSVLR